MEQDRPEDVALFNVALKGSDITSVAADGRVCTVYVLRVYGYSQCVRG